MINLLAAMWVRFRWRWQETGLLTLHLGLLVLAGGEFITGAFADEGLMRIEEGGSASYTEDVREVELAVVEQGKEQDHDRVVSVPAAMLAQAAASGQKIADPRLPVSVQVERWLPNAELEPREDPSAELRGFARQWQAQRLPVVRGVDAGDADTPAAVVSLWRDGERLGRWLVSARFGVNQAVPNAGDARIGVSLRFRRTYKPYRLHLIDFRHNRFVGTQIPKNFSSEVRLVDPRYGIDRRVKIWMNQPLRHAGETFYQASYKPDGSGTVLQVVRNPGWLLPYVASLLIGGGMAVHLSVRLIGFLRRPKPPRAAAKASEPDHATPSSVWVPWLIGGGAVLAGLLVASSGLWRGDGPDDPAMRQFASLPVSAGGHVKPMDSAARHVLLVSSGRDAVHGETDRTPAVRFLLDLVARPKHVADAPVVRVDHPGVLSLLVMEPEQGGRLPLAAIEPHWDEIHHQARTAQQTPARHRDAFQRGVLQLHRRVSTLLEHAQLHQPYVAPPLGPGGSWQSFHQAMGQARETGQPHPAAAYITSMMSAYQQGQRDRFRQALAEYDALLRRDMPGLMQRMDLEVLFNRADLFSGAISVYLLGLLAILACLLLRGQSGTGATQWAERLRVSGVGLILAALIVHSLAIAARIYFQGRPPVTNLYSSAVFVGWAAVLAGLVLERISRLGLAALASAGIGLCTLIVAAHLGSEGDTMQMMQAVLDSNFWLGTHVITIALGYSATFLAGGLGVIYVLGHRLPWPWDATQERSLAGMIYGTACFALLLSFVGTVLGGIWADQSWGRFWGWDPKENGAALVVLINAILLHARMAGLVRYRGMAVIAVGGNIVTAWSWFGTNMLGVGLHAYGFMDAAVGWMALFVLSQAVIMGIGIAPMPRETRPNTAH